MKNRTSCSFYGFKGLTCPLLRGYELKDFVYGYAIVIFGI